MPSSGPPKPGAGRAYLGLAMLGWGLSILIGVTPHEDPWVGAGLAVFGLALTVSAPQLPELPRALRPGLVAGAGLAVALGVVAFDAMTGAGLDGPKLAMVGLGVGLAASAPFLGRSLRLRLGHRRMRSVSVSSLVVAAVAVLAAPLAVWGLQAAAKGAVGTTPNEAFVRFALIVPVGLLLQGLGMKPHVDGQTITYSTLHGPLSLEVGAACSGVQAMALFAGVLALFLWIEKPAGRRLALWSAIGIVGVYAANLLRLGMLVLVGYRWGPDALVQAHAQAGWIFFVGWALLFSRMARRPALAA